MTARRSIRKLQTIFDERQKGAEVMSISIADLIMRDMEEEENARAKAKAKEVDKGDQPDQPRGGDKRTGDRVAIASDLDQVEAMHGEALAIHERRRHKEGMAADYGNLAIVYAKRGDLDQAEAMCRKALAINKALGHKSGMASQYTTLGILHWKRGALGRAEA